MASSHCVLVIVELVTTRKHDTIITLAQHYHYHTTRSQHAIPSQFSVSNVSTVNEQRSRVEKCRLHQGKNLYNEMLWFNLLHLTKTDPAHEWHVEGEFLPIHNSEKFETWHACMQYMPMLWCGMVRVEGWMCTSKRNLIVLTASALLPTNWCSAHCLLLAL